MDGTVAVLTNDLGRPTDSYTYDAFGELIHKGLEAHSLFYAYARSVDVGTFYDTPIGWMFPILWGEPGAGGKPDVTDTRTNKARYYELKPVSNLSSIFWAMKAQVQLAQYKLLHRVGIYAGAGTDIALFPTMIGYIPDFLGGYEVWLYPGSAFSVIQGQFLDTQGLLFYALRERPRARVEVT